MMLRKLSFAIVILSFLFVAALPTGVALAAKKVTLTVANQTGVFVNITLTGPRTINFKNVGYLGKYKIEPGVYTYTYYTCTQTHTGVLDATKNVKLKIAKCPPGMADPITITLQNETGGFLSLQLTGHFKSYNFNLPPGENKITVIPGRYRYMATGCGGRTAKGRLWLTSTKHPWVWTCNK